MQSSAEKTVGSVSSEISANSQRLRVDPFSLQEIKRSLLNSRAEREEDETKCEGVWFAGKIYLQSVVAHQLPASAHDRGDI